jgi:hypothetical protein
MNFVTFAVAIGMLGGRNGMVRSALVTFPAAARAGFVAGFRAAAKNGLQVGAGQSGSSVQTSHGLPQQVMFLIERVAHEVFTNAFVTAMRVTIVLPIAVICVAAPNCFAIKGGTAPRSPSRAESTEISTAA